MLAFDRAILERDRITLDVAYDRASARSFDKDGRMHVAKCRISKANVCPYYGREIPNARALNLDPNKLYFLYRAPEELQKAASSFKNAQLLALHAKVTAANPQKEITVGTVGGEISFDGSYLVAEQITVWDKLGIDLIETDEAKELSSSYHYRAEMTAGRSPEGVAYDGVMRDIKANHVALVPDGRAGSDIVVNDALPSELSNMPLKRPNLFARLMALGVLPAGTYGEEEKVALDAKLESMTAKDSMPDVEEDMEDDPENPGKKRKKGKPNPGKGEAGKAGGALAKDEMTVAIEDILKTRGYVTKEEADKLASDSAAGVIALYDARREVEPLVGVVAMDSAENVYKFALEKEGVALDGVPAAAYGALVKQRLKLKAAPAAGGGAAIVKDSNVAASAIPGLGRISIQ